MIDSWMISVVIALVAAVGQWFVLKSKVTQNEKYAEDLSEYARKTNSVMFSRLDNHGDDIVALKTKAELAMTAKDVDDKYVSKELFRQFEKHIDKRFDNVEKNLNEILNHIRKENEH